MKSQTMNLKENDKNDQEDMHKTTEWIQRQYK
jgi:hypothetical protein